MMRTGLLLLSVQVGWSQSWVQGTVRERAGDLVRPLPHAFVSVSSPAGEPHGVTRTDGHGRYRLVGLPPERLIVTAFKPGFQARDAAGRSGARVVIDCSRQCAQDGLDFELFRGAVITGVVVDLLGEPVSRARVAVQPAGAVSEAAQPAQDTSDDRGRFRIAGLRPGRYRLAVEGRLPSGQPERYSQDVSLAEGEQLEDLTITLGSQGSFPVTGRLGGVPYGEGYRTWITLRALDGSNRRHQANVAGDGSFRFDPVPAGRYLGRAFAVERATFERSEYLLDVIDVRAEIQGLILQPVSPARLTGTVEVAAGVIRPNATVQLTSLDGFGHRWFRCGGGKREFDLSGVIPGTYRMHARSAGFYVKGIKIGESMETSNIVNLGPGHNQLTVVVAADHGLVSGTVRDPVTRELLPHAQVALQGPRGTLSTQTDQVGRFEFGAVIPGEYRICAWAGIAPEAIEDEASWQRGDCAFKYIPIAAQSEIEIDLHAAP